MTPRPQTLAEIAQRSETLPHFGREFQDWLHTVRALRTRGQIAAAIASEPTTLRARFPEGQIADAWLAAYAEYAAELAALPVPKWATAPARTLREPWYSVEPKTERELALRDSPDAFRKRNLFTPHVDLPLRLRAGRPTKTAEEKRQTNAARQRRFRTRRAVELHLLHASLQQL